MSDYEAKAAKHLLSNPIFLGGENRSGTTLLSVILDSHPDLRIAPEIDFTEPVNLGPHILEACDFMDENPAILIGATKDSIPLKWYDGIHFVAQCERSGLCREAIRSQIVDVMKRRRSNLLDLDDRCFLIESLGEYLREKAGKQRWGIKLQRKIKDVARYSAIWPRAHFIHIIRDGRDLSASHLKTVPDWGYKSVAEAAKGWLEIVGEAHRMAPRERYLEIKYEELVLNPQTVLRQIVDFLGLPWSEAPLRHTEQHHALNDNPWGHPAAEAVSKPLYTDRSGRYMKDLSPAQIKEFEKIAGDELQRLGYGLTVHR